MEPASWVQDLDVDDSDLHSLRRCNRQRSSDQNPSTTTYTSQSQTLDSAPSQSQHINSVPPTLTSATIPGPAGIVQAAKLRKTRDIDCLGQEQQLMATQEYIRKVVEDPKEDEDFKRRPWLSAMEFLCAHGGETSSASSAPLGQISKYQKSGKLNQVVAVIKSCAPNELGDMTVALKDPTGTVYGTIHHKVLTEGDIRKGICVGSVLILYNVSVFSPSQSTHYLNITRRNLLKIFYKDGGSSQNLTFKNGTIDAVPHFVMHNSIHPPSQDSGRETRSASAFFLERGAEEITSRMKRSKNNEAETAKYCETINKDPNMKIARDEEIFKVADLTEKAETVGQLTQGFTSEFMCAYTDEQLLAFDI